MAQPVPHCALGHPRIAQAARRARTAQTVHRTPRTVHRAPRHSRCTAARGPRSVHARCAGHTSRCPHAVPSTARRAPRRRRRAVRAAFRVRRSARRMPRASGGEPARTTPGHDFSSGARQRNASGSTHGRQKSRRGRLLNRCKARPGCLHKILESTMPEHPTPHPLPEATEDATNRAFPSFYYTSPRFPRHKGRRLCDKSHVLYAFSAHCSYRHRPDPPLIHPDPP